MLDTNRPVQLRDGRPARIVATNVTEKLSDDAIRLPGQTILAKVRFSEEGGDEYAYFDEFGHFTDGDSDNDLVNAPETLTSYVNLGHGYSRPEYARDDYTDFPVLKVVRESGTDKIVSAEIVEVD